MVYTLLWCSFSVAPTRDIFSYCQRVHRLAKRQSPPSQHSWSGMQSEKRNQDVPNWRNITRMSLQTVEALNDAQYVAPLVETGDYHSSLNSKSWFYVFDYQTKNSNYKQVGTSGVLSLMALAPHHFAAENAHCRVVQTLPDVDRSGGANSLFSTSTKRAQCMHQSVMY